MDTRRKIAMRSCWLRVCFHKLPCGSNGQRDVQRATLRSFLRFLLACHTGQAKNSSTIRACRRDRPTTSHTPRLFAPLDLAFPYLHHPFHRTHSIIQRRPSIPPIPPIHRLSRSGRPCTLLRLPHSSRQLAAPPALPASRPRHQLRRRILTLPVASRSHTAYKSSQIP